MLSFGGFNLGGEQSLEVVPDAFAPIARIVRGLPILVKHPLYATGSREVIPGGRHRSAGEAVGSDLPKPAALLSIQ